MTPASLMKHLDIPGNDVTLVVTIVFTNRKIPKIFRESIELSLTARNIQPDQQIANKAGWVLPQGNTHPALIEDV